jgi:hypothetical protein
LKNENSDRRIGQNNFINNYYKYLELSVAMRNLWCLEKISILPLVISATGIVPQSLFKNFKILDLDNTLVELVPTVMIDDLDKSCAKAEPNFDK